MSNNKIFTQGQISGPKVTVTVKVSDNGLTGIADLVKKGAFKDILDHPAFDLFIQKLREGADFPGCTAKKSFEIRNNLFHQVFRACDVPVIAVGDYDQMANCYMVLRGAMHASEVCPPGITVGCGDITDSRLLVPLHLLAYQPDVARSVYQSMYGEPWDEGDLYKRGYCYLAMLTEKARSGVIDLIMAKVLDIGPVLDLPGYIALRARLEHDSFCTTVKYTFVKGNFHCYPTSLEHGERIVGAKRFFDGLHRRFLKAAIPERPKSDLYVVYINEVYGELVAKQLSRVMYGCPWDGVYRGDYAYLNYLENRLPAVRSLVKKLDMDYMHRCYADVLLDRKPREDFIDMAAPDDTVRNLLIDALHYQDGKSVFPLRSVIFTVDYANAVHAFRRDIELNISALRQWNRRVDYEYDCACDGLTVAMVPLLLALGNCAGDVDPETVRDFCYAMEKVHLLLCDDTWASWLKKRLHEGRYRAIFDV